MARRIDVILEDILRSIHWIETDTAGLGLQQFLEDRPIRQAVERNLEIISEASRRVPADLKGRYTQTPWIDVATVGNILRHEYHDVRPLVIWKIIQNDLPDLKTTITAMLAEVRDR